MDDKKMFCPNCGAETAKSAHFCKQCGFNIADYLAKQTSEVHTQPEQSGETPTNKTNAGTDNDSVGQKYNENEEQTRAAANYQTKPQKKLPKWATILIACVVVLLIGGYMFGSDYYQKSKQLDRTISAIQGDKNVAHYFTTTDTNLKITNKNMEPFVKSMTDNKQKLSILKSQLGSISGMTTNQKFIFKLDGKAWLLFPKYQVFVKPVYPIVSTNHTDVTLSVDKKKVLNTTATKLSKKIGPLVPGLYNLKSTGTVNGHAMTNSADYEVDSNKAYDLSLKTISFDVKGYANSKIYLNDKYKGTIDSSGVYSFNNIPWSSVMKLQLRYKTGQGTISSTTKSISESDDGTEISVDFPGIMTKSDASDELDSIFSGFEAVAADGEESDATDYNGNKLSESFINGSSNSQYQDLLKMSKGYYKDDDINSVSYDPEVKSIVPSGRNSADVTYDVTFDFDDSDNERVQIYRYVATFVQNSDTDEGYQVKTITPSKLISDKKEDND
ncbi:hypothetical protein BSQ38_06255 [Pediococcus damnosus]|uniref:zinc ribbon domain-containing protein n=1 Tax=Pediococcus damnosus TaxID=51663 RepID=UPI000C1CBAC0|nr:zinc-ribbon domain-containing protein [Pediococcus damnosus]PIO81275.1 hypothetical protein BSQ38_06255 [Pediococcus damnosus]